MRLTITTCFRDIRSGFSMLVVALLMTATVSGCHRGPSVVAGREVFHPEWNWDPNAIRRTATGQFVIAMATTTATAAMTDSDGALVWKYQEPPSEGSSGLTVESTFNGVVPLANGNVLLCGERKRLGLLVILDAKGSKISEALLRYQNDDQYSGSFRRCLPWNGGVALVGEAIQGSLGSLGWVVKLDKDGAKEWEVADKRLWGKQAVPTSDGSLVVGGADSTGMHVAKLDQQGRIAFPRQIPASGGMLLGSTTLANTVSLAVYEMKGPMMIYTLDEHLEDIGKPQALSREIDITQGCGYARADGSRVLFGRTNNAARAVVANDGTILDEKDFGSSSAYSVVDAVPIGDDTFVSLRRILGPSRQDLGLRMSWDTLK